jgi:agmatine/peptidylarginine deiminase
MSETNNNLEYMIELHKNLNGSFSMPVRKGGLISKEGKGKLSLSFSQILYFRNKNISSEKAERIMEDILTNDLIIYPIEQGIEYDK